MLRDQLGLHICSGVIYGCKAASTGLFPPCVSPRPGAGLMSREWALAQRCCPTSVLCPAEKGEGREFVL